MELIIIAVLGILFILSLSTLGDSDEMTKLKKKTKENHERIFGFAWQEGQSRSERTRNKLLAEQKAAELESEARQASANYEAAIKEGLPQEVVEAKDNELLLKAAKYMRIKVALKLLY